MIDFFCLVVIYPILHELGHCIFALSCSVEIMGISLYPPSVLCNFKNTDILKIMLVGIGGITFPAVLSIIIFTDKILIWYSNLVIKIISIYELIVSILSIPLYDFDFAKINIDANIILNYSNESGSILLILCSFLAFCLLLSIILSNPVSKMTLYFAK